MLHIEAPPSLMQYSLSAAPEPAPNAHSGAVPLCYLCGLPGGASELKISLFFAM
jgi:hypothetical protein